ncbi:MAG: P-loop NTPase [Spirochaetales bacterium]|nr:P-loop NTPase [Spirochaetales bacterium]
MVKKEDVLKALSEIQDPDLHKDIVSLGFIKELVISGSKVSFSIELTTPACPVKNQFKEAAEKLVSQVEGVEKVHVTMTARNSRDEAQENGLKKVKQIIAVASAKGGVGKSTVAATLACELKDQGYKTGLLDTDLFGPSVPTLFNITKPEVYQRNNMLIPLEKEGLKLMSFGFLLGDAPAIMRGPMVSGYMQQILLQVDWGELDYLIIDMPPGTGDIQLTLSQTIQVDGAVIVTTRAALSLVDVARGILMFEKVGVPMLGVVENMSHFICDSCDKEHYIFGEAKAPGERFGLETLAQIPIEPGRGRHMENYTSNDLNKTLVLNIARALGRATAGKIDPPEVVQKETEISVTWADGRVWKLDAVHLRSSCRCALCVDEYTGEKILNDDDIPSDIRVEDVTPLGNYALSFTWSDGHSSGIFPYTQLEELSR